LAPIAASLGIELIEIEEFGGGGHRFLDVHPLQNSISSTRIRKALQEGRIEDATEMLGYGYSLTGVVVAGNRMGRTIGFPTANLRPYEPLKLIPARGVYVVEAEVLGKRYRGMTDIGTRPTVGGTFPTIETHILDFDEDIYGLPLTITFLRRLRDEIHFPSLDALRQQLERDRAACR
jgi:riboflavin kinase/FMN adenylyltransferase